MVQGMNQEQPDGLVKSDPSESDMMNFAQAGVLAQDGLQTYQMIPGRQRAPQERILIQQDVRLVTHTGRQPRWPAESHQHSAPGQTLPPGGGGKAAVGIPGRLEIPCALLQGENDVQNALRQSPAPAGGRDQKMPPPFFQTFLKETMNAHEVFQYGTLFRFVNQGAPPNARR